MLGMPSMLTESSFASSAVTSFLDIRRARRKNASVLPLFCAKTFLRSVLPASVNSICASALSGIDDFRTVTHAISFSVRPVSLNPSPRGPVISAVAASASRITRISKGTLSCRRSSSATGLPAGNIVTLSPFTLTSPDFTFCFSPMSLRSMTRAVAVVRSVLRPRLSVSNVSL